MKRRLLLVDDEDAIREIARISLERVGGWEVFAAASGREAVETVGRVGPVDAVLLDVMMPGLDGPSTMRALRAGPLATGVPFVFLTAKLQAVDRERLGRIGAAGVVAKPFDPMTLPEQLDRFLDGVAADESDGSGGARINPDFAGVWSQNRPVVQARVATIATAVAALSRGKRDQPLLTRATSAAHTLSGSLGTFGLDRGSELARCLETGLESGASAGRLQALSAELATLVACADSALAHPVPEPAHRLDVGRIA
ncbi:MAG TPA: response regulator [Solirubrobacterales bacterium]|jgi:CheY-like chemotaxis protein|nr:response regulator [Solirubrobacterales bacterium]